MRSPFNFKKHTIGSAEALLKTLDALKLSDTKKREVLEKMYPQKGGYKTDHKTSDQP